MLRQLRRARPCVVKVNAERSVVKRGLTLRSSGPPPARRLARPPASVIIRRAGQAPFRRGPLSSNVRPHKCPRLSSSDQYATARSWRSQTSWDPTKLLTLIHSLSRFIAKTSRRRRRSLLSWLQVSPSTVGRWRQVGVDGPERRSGAPSKVSSPSQLRLIARVTLLLPTSFAHRTRAITGSSKEPWSWSRVNSRTWHVSQAWCGLQARVRPNPSLERTSTGLALGPRAVQCHHPSRGPSANPAGSAQLKR